MLKDVLENSYSKNLQNFSKSAVMEYFFDKVTELNIKSCLEKDFIRAIFV